MDKNSAVIKAQHEITLLLSLIGPHEGAPTPTGEDDIGNAISLLHSARRYLNNSLTPDLKDDFRGGNALNRLKARRAGSEKK